MNTCATCNRYLTGNQKIFCSKECKIIFYKQTPDTNKYPRQKQKYISKKRILISENGNKCSKCGYNKNMAALHFHHVDKTNKTFNVDGRRIANNSLETLRKEVSKCILLCNNCHTEEHYPDYTL